MSRLINIVQVQKKGAIQRNRTQSRWSSTKIHAIVDAYGYPVYVMLSEGQRNDINYAIPLLEQVDIKESDILADRGYDSNKLMDYIYAHGGEPTIPSRKGAKFDRYCDWHLYKERHLVENYFLKLKHSVE
ncbi:transposase [Anaerobutyricum hallii]|uniref:transposase n=1 Tax=Anaerobutyricum hallii TaxID=39488 RepID=UPI00300EE3C7